jgi:proline dehydrogenase
MFVKSLLSFDDTSVAFSHKSDKELRKMHLLFTAINNRFLTKAGTKMVKIALKLKLPVQRIIKKTIYQQFCGGETLESCEGTIQKLGAYNVKTILDYAAEGLKNEKAYDQARNEKLAVIKKAAASASLPFCAFKTTSLGNIALLEKIQAKKVLSAKEEEAFQNIRARVENICKAAFEANVRILIDAEESWIQEVIDEIAETMMKKYNQDKTVIYNTYQMYRRDALADLRKAFMKAATYHYYLGVKLVRGAYMEKERERAQEMKYPDPIQPDRDATDDDYNKALLYCINNKQRISIFAGSHNEHSNYYLTLLMEKHGMMPNDPRVYFSQLYGMSDNISFNLALAGYNVAKYVPYGPIEAVVPYLFRRAEENTSVAGQSSRELNLIKKELQRRKQKSS